MENKNQNAAGQNHPSAAPNPQYQLEHQPQTITPQSQSNGNLPQSASGAPTATPAEQPEPPSQPAQQPTINPVSRTVQPTGAQLTPTQPNPAAATPQPALAPPQPTVLPAANAMPQQAAVTPAPAQPAPTVASFGQPGGSAPASFGTSSKKRLLLIGAGALLSVFILALYFFILPTYFANQYKNTIKKMYWVQSAQMPAAYKSLGKPVFGSAKTTEASDKADLATISVFLKSDQDATDQLKAKNHLTILPGTAWLPAVSSANKEYQSMQQYVTDSQKFIADYTSLVSYMKTIEQLTHTQLPKIGKDFAKFQSASTESALLAASRATTADLNALSATLKKSNPPEDLTQFNEDFINGINGINDGLQGIVSAVQSKDTGALQSAAGEFVTSLKNLDKLSQTNPTAHITTDSSLHRQIVTLQGEHPIPN